MSIERGKDAPQTPDIWQRFDTLTDNLIDQGIEWIEGYRRAQFRIPSGLKDEIVVSVISDFAKGQTHPKTGEVYPLENPDYISIRAENHQLGGSKTKNLEIQMEYDLASKEHNLLRLDIRPTEKIIQSYIFSSESIDDGYTGHNFKTHEPTPEQLDDLYTLIEQNAKPELLVKEKSLLEHLDDIKTADDLHQWACEPTPAQERYFERTWKEVMSRPRTSEDEELAKRVLEKTKERLTQENQDPSQ